MELSVSIDQNQLKELLLQVGLVRPVFIWGAPGIGKSAIVEQFDAELGLPCVCLTGSQLAPEDLIGVPQIVNGTSVLCPPRCLVQKEPFCLFLDELNACSLEVQKAFYSLILERRIGEYHLPDGSIVVGAGNRMQDNAITRQLPSALINRMVHVELRPSSRVWLEWAAENGIHPYVYDYLCARPDHLWSQPTKTEEPFSSPRSWHMLSDALYGCGASVSEQQLSVLAYGLPGRTAFSIYRFDDRDKTALAWLIFCGVYLISGWMAGGTYFRYYPTTKGVVFTPMTVSFMLVYLALVLTPVILDRKEDRQWKSLQSST